MFQQFSQFLLSANPYSWEMITILLVVGTFVGFVNTLAGMATALSYALFMAMGMPINVANGTTRVGVLSQFALSSLLFKKHGELETKLGVKVGIPIAIGSLLGAQAAATVNIAVIEVIMGLMLPIMAFTVIYNQRKGGEANRYRGDKRVGPLKFIAFILIGAYGGFTHAGIGILILFGSFYLLGLDMVKSNGIKQLAVVIYTPLALFIFILHGQINWPVAIIYAVGNVIGAAFASKIAVKRESTAIVNYIIAVAVVSISFWLIYKQF